MRFQVRYVASRVIPVVAMVALTVLPFASTTVDAATCPVFGCGPAPLPTTPKLQQLISNGGFENPSASPNWSLSSLTPAGAKYTSGFAHCGSSSVAMHSEVFPTGWFAGVWESDVSQSINIPATADGASLDFWALFPPYSYQHNASLVVMAAPGYSAYATIATYDNSTVTPGVWRHLGPINLSAFRGQTVGLLFSAVTTGPAPAYIEAGPIYLDDVSVMTGLHILSGGC
jgi:hypothetical protein